VSDVTQLGLVDGIVTEDSDAFLFGARTVYRNIFSDQKFVEVCEHRLGKFPTKKI
jgi:5'-3' exonuclease